MKLSIIIPVYNVEKYLRRCVDSVLCGSEGYEIVLVNDGATDSSGEICREYANKYPELVKLVEKENGGLGSARNAGIEAAKGEYILFLDSDDRLAENAVEEILSKTKESFDILFFDMIWESESGKQLNFLKGADAEESFSLSSNPEILFFSPCACNKVWRRSLFTENAISFPPRMWFEDMYTIPKLYLLAEKMLYAPGAWYYYLQREGSITQSKNPERNREIIIAVNEALDFFRAKEQFDKYREQLCYMSFYNLLAGISRVNLADKKSPVQAEIFRSFAENFPEYESNRYIRSMSKKYKLLLFFVKNNMFGCYNLIMSANNKIKGK